MVWEHHMRLESFWGPLAEQILIKCDGHSLSLKKVRSKLLKKASARLGKDAGDEGLAGCVNKYLSNAKATGELLFEGRHVQLPALNAKRQGPIEGGQPDAAGANREGEAGPTGRQHAPPLEHAAGMKAKYRSSTEAGVESSDAKAKTKRKKQGKAAGEAAELPDAQAAAPEGAPRLKKRKKRDKDEVHTAAAGVTGTQDHDTGQQPAGAPMSSMQRKAKKRRVQHAEGEAEAEQPGPRGDASAAAEQPPGMGGAVQEQCVPRAALAQGRGLAGALAALLAAQAGGQAVEARGQAAGACPAKAPRKASRRSRPAVPPPLAGAAVAEEEPGTWLADKQRTDVKTGYFSKAELQAIREGVEEFARTHDFSMDDTGWLFATRSSSSAEKAAAKGAWTAIAKRLPHRRMKAVWAAGTRMLHEGNFRGRWTAEEEAKLLELAAHKPGRWAEIGTALGRLPEGVRDKHRLLTGIAGGARKGRWNADEEAKLVELVEAFLAERQDRERAAGVRHEVGRRVVLDDISWDVIARQHGSRSEDQCKLKWYTSLSPSMVSRGDWGAGDDRRMLRALVRSGSTREWDVDWGGLVPQRSAQHAKRRWRLMLKCVPEHTEKEFHQILDFLVATYTPDLQRGAAGEGEHAGEGGEESEDQEGGQ